jgi:hypothetical protein
LSLISQNLDNFYQIQTNHYSAHLMRTVVNCSKSGVPDFGTEQGRSEREGMFPVTPVMHLTGGVHGLADKTGGPCGHQIPCFFSRPWRWYYYSPSPILTPTGRAVGERPVCLWLTPRTEASDTFRLKPPPIQQPLRRPLPASSKVRAARKKRPAPPPNAAD